jgi:hypothetical protein
VTKREEARFGHTITGRLWNFGGRILAVDYALSVSITFLILMVENACLTFGFT